MLLLKTNASLPISVRHLGHALSSVVKDLQSEIHSIDLSQYGKFKTVVEDVLYDMSVIARNIVKLGEPENFDLNKVYSKIEFYQNDYTNDVQNLIQLILERFDSDNEEMMTFLSHLLLEKSKVFMDDLDVSSITRVEKLQTLLDATSLSAINTVIHSDLSFETLVSDDLLKNAEYLARQTARSHFESDLNLGDNYENFFSDELMDAILNEMTDVLPEETEPYATMENSLVKMIKPRDDVFMKSIADEILPKVVRKILDHYDKIFVANEDLEQLKGNADKIAHTTLMTRKGKTAFLNIYHDVLELMFEELTSDLRRELNRTIIRQDI